VHYDSRIVATYRVDLLIDRKLLLEVKACAGPHRQHERQVINYLRATELELGLLLYFGDSPEVRRFVLRNELKRFIERSGTPR
jgi:GxxExxY protein